MPRYTAFSQLRLRSWLDRRKQQQGPNAIPGSNVIPHNGPGGKQTPAGVSPVGQSSVAVSRSALDTWGLAYEKKLQEESKLMAAYEALVKEDIIALTPQATSIQTFPSQATVAGVAKAKVEELESRQWEIGFAGRSIELHKQVKKLIRAILFAKDFVTPALSAEPHAGLAWAGVCVVLPLLCQPLEEIEKLVDGLNQIASYYCRFAVLMSVYEKHYAYRGGQGPTSNGVDDDLARLCLEVEKTAVDVLADMIEFQARTACQCSNGTVKRYLRAMANPDHWEALLGSINAKLTMFERHVQALGEESFNNALEELKKKLDQLESRNERILDLQRTTLTAVEQDLEMKCKDSLFTTHYKEHKRLIPVRVPGTCEWFTMHKSYKHWKSSGDSGILWLTADPGCGKSVLARHLVDDDLQSQSRATCYFFFRAGVDEQQTLVHSLAALLHQLYMQRGSLIHHAISAFKAEGRSIAGSAERMWDILLATCTDTAAGEVACVIDGLDECDPKDRSWLIARMRAFQLLQTKARLKFLITSRPYLDIAREFATLATSPSAIHLSTLPETSTLAAEISIVIDIRIKELKPKLDLSEAEAQRIAARLKAAQNRTYLWLVIMLEVMERSTKSTEKHIMKMVDAMPEGIYEAYEAMLSRSTDLATARKMLGIILVARPPLSINELNRAMAVDDDAIASGDLDIEPDEKFREKFRSLCGLFVVVMEDKVYFFHQTVREFLLNGMSTVQRRIPDAVFKLPMPLSEAHIMLATTCMKYILYKKCSRLDPDRFLTYSAHRWPRHLLECQPASSDRTKQPPHAALLDLVLSTCAAIDFWWPHVKHLRGNHTGAQNWPAVIILAKFGLWQMLDALLVSRQTDALVDTRDAGGYTALYYCMNKSGSATGRVLLDHGARVWFPDRVERSPLYTAVRKENLELVKMLIADMPRTDRHSCAMLFRAAVRRAPPNDGLIIDYLVDHGFHVGDAPSEIHELFRLAFAWKTPGCFLKLAKHVLALQIPGFKFSAIELDWTVLSGDAQTSLEVYGLTAEMQASSAGAEPLPLLLRRAAGLDSASSRPVLKVGHKRIFEDLSTTETAMLLRLCPEVYEQTVDDPFHAAWHAPNFRGQVDRRRSLAN